jgi:acyl-coenzyme A thioesterase PaaI-like protein
MITPDPTSRSARLYEETLVAASLPPERAQSPIRLASAIRELVRTVVGSTASDEALDRAATVVEDLVEALRPDASESRYEQAKRLGGSGTFLNHPMIGQANPLSPPISVEADEGIFTGHVTFGTAHEGPPGFAYGGYIAAGFDAALLMTAGVNGLGGPTRSLSVRYRRPTPLNVPLRYEARFSHAEERWVVVEGTLMAGDTVCASATAEVAQIPIRPA